MPPDPMNDLYSIMVDIFRESILLIFEYKYLKSIIHQNLILRSRSCDIAYIPQLIWILHFVPTNVSFRDYVYQRWYHSKGASRRGQPLNIFK